MNRIYQVIWSEARHMYVVVSEIARRHSKNTTSVNTSGARQSLLTSIKKGGQSAAAALAVIAMIGFVSWGGTVYAQDIGNGGTIEYTAQGDLVAGKDNQMPNDDSGNNNVVTGTNNTAKHEDENGKPQQFVSDNKTLITETENPDGSKKVTQNPVDGTKKKGLDNAVVSGHNAVAEANGDTSIGNGANITNPKKPYYADKDGKATDDPLKADYFTDPNGKVIHASDLKYATGETDDNGNPVESNDPYYKHTYETTVTIVHPDGTVEEQSATTSTVINQNSAKADKPSYDTVKDETTGDIITTKTKEVSDPTRNLADGYSYYSKEMYEQSMDSVAVGTNATVKGRDGVAAGHDAEAAGESVAVGHQASSAGGAVAVGPGASADTNGVATGINSKAAENGVASGNGANAGEYGVAVGDSSNAGDNSQAIGSSSQAVNGSTAVGENSRADWNSVTVGNNSNAIGVGSAALGNNSSAVADGGVALGNDSVADRGAENYGWDPVTKEQATAEDKGTDPVWYSKRGAVSVGISNPDGTPKETRQIINVAAGTNDSDAVNVAQLKSAVEKTQSHYYSWNDRDDHQYNYDNEGATGNRALAAGVGASANGDGATSVGNYTNASGKTSIAIGGTELDADGNKKYEQVPKMVQKVDDNGQPVTDDEGNPVMVQATDDQGNLLFENKLDANNNPIPLNTEATGENAIAVGTNAKGWGDNSIAIGTDSQASHTDSTAMGHSSNAWADHASAFGAESEAGENATAVGDKSHAYGTNGTSIGFNSTAAQDDTAVGSNAHANASMTTAVGMYSSAEATQATAMGTYAVAKGSQSTSMGCFAHADNQYATAVGYTANSTGQNSTTVGYSANGNSEGSTAVGSSAYAPSSNATAVGRGANASAENATAVGYYLTASGKNSTAVGYNATAYAEESTAVGHAFAPSKSATAVGYQATASGTSSTAVGHAYAPSSNATAVGEQANASDTDATAVGHAYAHNTRATAVGSYANAAGRDSTAVGYAFAAYNQDTAVGNESGASGSYSTAVGAKSSASSNESTAIGYRAKAGGSYSVAIGGGIPYYEDNYDDSTGNMPVASFNYAIAIGQKAAASNERTIALGATAKASSSDAIAIGSSSSGDTSATGSDAIAIGSSAKATSSNAVGIGLNANAYASNAVRIGSSNSTGSNAAAVDAVSIGTNANAWGEQSVRIGWDENTSNNGAGYRSVSIGVQSKANNSSVAIGTHNNASGSSSTAVGENNNSGGSSSTAVGFANTTGNSASYSTAVGYYNETQGFQSAALGVNNKAMGSYSYASGYDSHALKGATGTNGHMSIGGAYIFHNTTDNSDTYVDVDSHKLLTDSAGNVIRTTSGTVVMQAADGNYYSRDSEGNYYKVEKYGANTYSQKDQLTNAPTGLETLNSGGYMIDVGDNVAVGNHDYAYNYGASSMGFKNKAYGYESSAVGYGNEAKGVNSGAFGYESKALGNNSFASGYKTQAVIDDSVALGGLAYADRVAATSVVAEDGTGTDGKQYIGYDVTGKPHADDMTGVWRSTKAAVSIGDVNNRAGNGIITRQITDVAAGSELTDAVNVAQLKALENKFVDTDTKNKIHDYSVLSLGIDNDTNYNNEGAKAENAMAAGVNALATGRSSIAIGEATANGDQSIAIGKGAVATGYKAVVIGANTAVGQSNMAFGEGNHAGVEGDENGAYSLLYNDTKTGKKANTLTDLQMHEAWTDTNGKTQSATETVDGKTNSYLVLKTRDGGKAVLKDGNVYNVNNDGTVGVIMADKDFNYLVTHSTFKDGAVFESADSKQGGKYATAFGLNNVASGDASLAFGGNAIKADEPNGKKAPTGNKATGINAVAFGNSTLASGQDTVAFGDRAKATNDEAVAFGQDTLASAARATAFGESSVASGQTATAFGYHTKASGTGATALGNKSQATGMYSMAWGGGDRVTGKDDKGNDIKTGPIASGLYSTAFGSGTQATAENATAFGELSNATAKNATAFGKSSKANAENSLAALGGTVETDASNSAAIGNGAKATLSDAIALGSGAVANTASGAEGYDPLGTGKISTDESAVWKSTKNAISIGNIVKDANGGIDTANSVTRQITGVAAGTNDTDAVNVAQLKRVAQQAEAGTKHTLVTVNQTKTAAPKDAKGAYTDEYDTENGNLNIRAETVGGQTSFNIKLNDQIGLGKPGTPGQDGKDGVDGKVTVTQKDGTTIIIGKDGEDGAPGLTIKGPKGDDGTDGKDAVAINGKDGIGTIGLAGKDGTKGTDGKDGISTTTIRTEYVHEPGVDGANGKDGQPGETRIIYKDPDNKDHTVATTEDGLKFTGNNNETTNTNKLNTRLTVEGEGDYTSKTENGKNTLTYTTKDKNGNDVTNTFTSAKNNIAVVANDGKDNDSKLTVELNKDVNLGKDGSLTVGGDTTNNDPVVIKNQNVTLIDKYGNTTTTKETGDYITGLDNRTWNVDNPTYVSGRAATEDELKQAGDQIINKITNGVTNVDQGGGFGLQDEHTGKVSQNLGTNIQVIGDGTRTYKEENGKKVIDTVTNSNITTKVVDLEDGTKAVKVALSDNVNVGGNDGKDGHIGVNGKDGRNGTNGKDAVSINAIGKDGEKGADGQIGVNGKDGTSIIIGKDAVPGENGKDGLNGISVKGDPGKDGQSGVTIVGPQGENGRDGLSGIDGKVGISGKDGKDAVSISGKDGVGHIGLTGEPGKDGKSGAVVDISVASGQNGVDGTNGADGEKGKNGMDRIVYTDHNGTPQEVATTRDGLNFTGNNSDTVNHNKLNTTVNVVGEGTGKDLSKFQSASGNIAVEANGGSDDQSTLTIKLNKDLANLNSVTTNNAYIGGNTTINNNGITTNQVVVGNTTVTQNSITVKNGTNVDMGDNQIHNVKAGTAPTDAVNVSQLGESNTNINNRISELGDNINRVGAGAAALAGLHPLDFDPDEKLDFAAGYGHYRNANAAAIGAYYRPNEDTMFSLGATVGNGDTMVNAGISWKFGQHNHVSVSRVAMAKEIIELRKELENVKSYLADQATGQRLDLSKIQLFPDTPENHWAYDYVATMAGNGVLEGYPDGYFKGNRNMTRYEMAAVLYRMMQNGAKLSERALTEFAPELDRIRVDTISKDSRGIPHIQRVRTVKGRE